MCSIERNRERLMATAFEILRDASDEVLAQLDFDMDDSRTEVQRQKHSEEHGSTEEAVKVFDDALVKALQARNDYFSTSLNLPPLKLEIGKWGDS